LLMSCHTITSSADEWTDLATFKMLQPSARHLES
jgi:hypothetical protein